MKILFPPVLPARHAWLRLPLSVDNFVQVPLGRAVLHLECLCHHPAAARFYLKGLMRNLGECIQPARRSALKWLTRASE